MHWASECLPSGMAPAPLVLCAVGSRGQPFVEVAHGMAAQMSGVHVLAMHYTPSIAGMMSMADQ